MTPEQPDDGAPWNDPIVEEVRAARQAIWEEAGGTMEGMLDYLQKAQAREKDRRIIREPESPSPVTDVA